MWVLFSFLTAFLETGKDVIGKKSSYATNEFVTAFAVQFFALGVLIPFVVVTGVPQLTSIYWWAVLGATLTVPSANILYMRAIKLSPLSISIPMLSFNPIFTALFSFLFDKKLPDLSGWLGIVLICIGLYLSRLSRKIISKGLLYPFLTIKDEPGALSMLGVALIWSAGAHISKMVVIGSSPLFGAFSFTLVGSITLFLIAKLKSKISLRIITSNIRQFAPLGAFNGFSELAMFSALTTGLTPYVVSIKRTNILWSSVMGKILFGEDFNKLKLLGLIFLLSGIVLIVL